MDTKYELLKWKSTREARMSEGNLTIELLYFDDCPSWRNALSILNDLLAKLEVSEKVVLIPVETQEEAEENRFTGSPMIRVNGEDLFPTDQENYSLGCRVYQTPEGLRGWPTEEMIEKQVTKFFNLGQ
ncbi:MAG: thioredoxin family protein [Anaerolineales bacterium]|jgi:hypothetical protein